MATSKITCADAYSQEVIASVSGTLTASKCGRIVTLSWWSGKTSTSEITLATLPTKYRPLLNQSTIGQADYFGRMVISVLVLTSGKITLNQSSAEKDYAEFSLSYIGNEEIT